jgi:hypothetical protein
MMLDFPQPMQIKYKVPTARSYQCDDLIFLNINGYTFEHLNILLGRIVKFDVS